MNAELLERIAAIEKATRARELTVRSARRRRRACPARRESGSCRTRPCRPRARKVASVRSGSTPPTPVSGSIVVTTQRSQRLTPRNPSAPMRSRAQPSSANGAQPVTTTLGRKRVILIGAGRRPFRSASDASEMSRKRVGVGEADDVAGARPLGVHRAPVVVGHVDQRVRRAEVAAHPVAAVGVNDRGAGVRPDLHLAPRPAARGVAGRRSVGRAGASSVRSSSSSAGPHQGQLRVRPLGHEHAVPVDDHPAPVAGEAALDDLGAVDADPGAPLDRIDVEGGDADHGRTVCVAARRQPPRAMAGYRRGRAPPSSAVLRRLRRAHQPRLRLHRCAPGGAAGPDQAGARRLRLALALSPRVPGADRRDARRSGAPAAGRGGGDAARGRAAGGGADDRARRRLRLGRGVHARLPRPLRRHPDRLAAGRLPRRGRAATTCSCARFVKRTASGIKQRRPGST